MADNNPQLNQLTEAINKLTSAFASFKVAQGGANAGAVAAGTALGMTAISSGVGSVFKSFYDGTSKLITVFDKAASEIVTWSKVLKDSSKSMADAFDKARVKFNEAFLPDQKLGEKESEIQVKKQSTILKDFGTVVTRLGLTLTGFITAGLSGTYEGYQLSKAMSYLSYVIASLAIKPIRMLTDGIIQATNWLNSMSGTTRQVIGYLIAFIAALGTATMVVKASGVGSLMLGIGTWFAGALKITLTTLLLTIGKAGLALIGLAAAGYSGYKTYGEAKKFGLMGGAEPGGYVDTVGGSRWNPFNWLMAGGYAGGPNKQADDTEAKTQRMFKGLTKGAKETYGKNISEDMAKPMFKVSFTNLEGLWEQAQKMVVEDPGLSLQQQLLEVTKSIDVKVTPKDQVNNGVPLGA